MERCDLKTGLRFWLALRSAPKGGRAITVAIWCDKKKNSNHNQTGSAGNGSIVSGGTLIRRYKISLPRDPLGGMLWLAGSRLRGILVANNPGHRSNK